jgi:hypothetical protein
MGTNPMRIRSLLVAGLSCSLWVASANAQPQLKQQEQLQAVAKQRIDAAIRDALSEAQRLQASGSTQRAADRLRGAMKMLEDPLLPKDFTDTRRNQLSAAIKATEGGLKPAIDPPASNPNRDVDAAKLKAMMEADTEIRRGIDTVGALMKAGELGQAKKEVEALTKKYPDNLTVKVMPDLVNKTKTLEDIKEIHVRQIEHIRLALADLQKASTLPKYDYELPADWKEITERRKTKLSAEMKAVLTGLKTPITLDAKNTPISDLLKSLSEKTKLPILLDKATMQEVGLEVSSPVSVSTEGPVQARTALKLALANFGLTYIVKGGTIQVVTREKASQTMETRVYYVGDLVAINNTTIGTIRFGPGTAEADRQAMQRNVEQLIDHIKKMDPHSWKGGGSDGKGEITFHAASMALVVKASAEVHGMLSGSFGK